ncbi:MAG: phenylalanine--tRNA ligase subunit beta [candidate division Zixibacteria bacterium]|nr:phenylalanine--tRNA ligase subunit beta [candidate division Zixibacteria bacterium]
MNISYKWLCELTGLDWSPEEMADRLTLCGTACEHIEATDRYLDKVVVGHVKDVLPIEGADKIRKAVVDIGAETLELVCGAPNVAVGQKVPVALIGAELAGGFQIKKARIRGIVSIGMICSERELGISDDHAGIWVLPDDAPVGDLLADYLDFRDFCLSFELTPNRGDSMSAIGIARDLAALGSIKLRRPECPIEESAEKASDHISVSIDDPEACPRYAARVIKGVKQGPSPWWLKMKLLTAGIRPISNVVDITNLVMIETGQPLHAFDLNRFGSNEVVVRRAGDKEKFTTLDGQEHTLTPEVLLITNGKKAVAAGGIMGGEDSEVSDDTTDILLEAAYFNPGVIRRGRKQLGFVTESSSRFEKGADPNCVPYAINRAAHLLQKLCGGEVLGGIVDCYPNEIKPASIDFRPSRCNKVLGTNLSVEKMRTILTDLEYEVTNGEGDTFQVRVPTYRTDIVREIDLIEEIVRIYGFDNVPDAISNVGPLYTPIRYPDVFNEELATILTGVGFDEMLNHGLADSRTARLLNPDADLLKIINPISEELDIMRNSVVHTALDVVKLNLAHRNMDIRLFEIGRCFFPPDAKDNWVEEDRLVMVVSGHTENSWRSTPRPLDFYDLKGAIDQLAGHFDWPAPDYVAADVPYFDDDISFEVRIDSQKVGEIGQIAKAVSTKLGIKQTIFVADLSLSVLIGKSNRLVEYEPLPVYPSASRDISMTLDEQVRTGDLIAKVKKTAGELARSVQIFDLYAGKQIEKGKKSIAVSIVYRSDERSLESAEVDKQQQDVTDMLKDDFKAEIRDN